MRATKIGVPTFSPRKSPSVIQPVLSSISPADQVGKRLQKAREQRKKIDTALKAAPEALQPIIALHSPTSGDECRGCDAGVYAESGADWPCSTIALIIGEDAWA